MLYTEFQTNLDYILKSCLQIERGRQVDLYNLETALVCELPDSPGCIVETCQTVVRQVKAHAQLDDLS